MRAASEDTEDLPRLLKRIYRFRARQRETRRWRVGALLRRRRKAALVTAFQAHWTGGYLLTDTGELAFLPAAIDFQAQRLMFYGFTAPPVALAFAPQGGVAIDVGANLGEWSVPLAKAVGEAGLVLCCEPNPPIATALAATLRINNLAQATVIEAALSAVDGDGALAVDTANSGASRLASAGGLPVRLRRLDTIVAEHGLDRVDLVKIDVEGHERQVFDGGIATLRRFRPVVVFESGHEGAADRDAIADHLRDLDYDVVAVLHDYGALVCDLDDYRAARGACRGGEPRNLLALPRGPATPP